MRRPPVLWFSFTSALCEFRHTVVSLLLHNGVDKISVADFVGDDPATLDRYDAHLINDGRVQAANAMNSIIGFATTEIPAE